MADVYAIINQKGGTGKTTTAENLAAALALHPEVGGVLVVDADPQRSLTLALTEDAEPWEIVTINEGQDGAYDLLTGDSSLVNADVSLTWLEDELRPHMGSYDVILVDCPPNLSMVSMGALYAAEHIVVPTQAAFLSAAGIDELFRTIRAVRKQGGHVIETRALITMHERNNAVREMERQIRDAWPCYETVIRKNAAVSHAQAAGLDVIHYDRRCNAAKDYASLANEIMES